MREWADVYLASLDDRLQVQRFALFYIPKALGLMSQNDITRSKLSNFAQFHKDSKSAGKQAITKVADCKPAVYDSVLGFIYLFNAYCKREGLAIELSITDIVACVFRFEGLHNIITDVGLSKQQLQEQTGIAAPVVEAAIGGFRLQLSDCLKISQAIKQSPQFGATALDELIFVTQKISRNSIKKIAVDNYVYRREYLHPAPVTGHPWSIQE
ncbi:hypothetical protein [Rhizobium leguminosarum]|uniref:hypothetical protein n=1 Tax=Rhizobium leguminosarum TaxID=384 RepID=UPI001C9284CA|nr:hypothetical protein [Rhizobium leguminosarum]MBY2985659.1 hypothetical protein [Rhizobium leguminosarum]